MILLSVRVQNFRSILDDTLQCDDLTALVGRNGTGKSTFLRALELFYDPALKVDEEDYYNRDSSQAIVISVCYRITSEAAKERFTSYMQGDTLTVERVFEWNEGKSTGTYHGSKLQNSEFVKIREAGGAKEQKSKYEVIRNEYGLPAWSNQTVGLAAMKDWEELHPGQCVRHRDDGRFFGFTSVGTGYLGDYTRFLFVPAVREASDDATDGKGTIFSTLMDLVVRSVIATKADYVALKKETQTRYEEIMKPENLPELTGLGENITRTLQNFVPDSRLALEWRKLSEVNIPMPQADARLVEDGFEAHIARTGHGLQRAFIVAMLQQLTLAQAIEKNVNGASENDKQEARAKIPNFVLAIEEPEVYQHPSRQRHFSKILHDLSSGAIPGVSGKTQILYATHSPLFVGIDRIDNIRLLVKKSNCDGFPKITVVVRTKLDDIASKVWRANGETGSPFTGETLRPRLKAIMTPWMNEGFFSDVVVLVEGEDDRAAILGFAQVKGHQFDSMGISVIPCGGKNNIDRPALIFRSMGIPVYALWDGDHGRDNSKPEQNHLLLRVFDKTIEDWPEFVDGTCACFKKDLEATLESEIGVETFNELLKIQQDEIGIPDKKHALKNPIVLERIIRTSITRGINSPTMNSIVKRIVALKDSDPGSILKSENIS